MGLSELLTPAPLKSRPAAQRLTSSSRPQPALREAQHPLHTLWEPVGRGIRAENILVKAHYFLITFAEAEGEGFHRGARLAVAGIPVCLLHSRPWRAAAVGRRGSCAPRPGFEG